MQPQAVKLIWMHRMLGVKILGVRNYRLPCNRNMKQIGIYLFAVLALLAIVIVAENIYMRLQIKRTEHRNESMAILCDRARKNPHDVDAINSLILSVHSDNFLERSSAISFLGQVGSNAQPAVPILIEALNHNDLYDAREAAISLGEIGVGAKQSVPSLIKAMTNHENEDVGWFAAESLGNIAEPNDMSTIVALQQSAKSTNDNMRRCANIGLNTLDSRRQEADTARKMNSTRLP